MSDEELKEIIEKLLPRSGNVYAYLSSPTTAPADRPPREVSIPVEWIRRGMEDTIVSPPAKQVTMTRDTNLRSGPGSGYADLGDVHPGAKLDVIAEEGEWVKITGWVWKRNTR